MIKFRKRKLHLKLKWGLLPGVICAIAAGIACGLFFPEWLVRVSLTFNGLFGNFLGFIIPLLIVGLVAPGIAELGRSAGKLLFITAALAYGFTLASGFFSYGVSELTFPYLLDATAKTTQFAASAELKPYFTVAMPPLMDVMTALVLAFTLGLGMAVIQGSRLKGVMLDLRDIIDRVIARVIIPLLPYYIFGIFLNMTVAGQVVSVLGVFAKIIVLIFAITAVMLVLQFTLAGLIARQNPFKMLKTMLVAYMTALGTQSSAATIPVTLKQTIKIGVREEVAGFVVPLCATIHLSGSTMKIVACALAIVFMSGMNMPFEQFAGFICMLGVTMVAAPGVPGGAIMAALGILQSMLGFGEAELGLMIALYIAMDSFGTACNVTGDGSIAVIVNKIYSRRNPQPQQPAASAPSN
ncbi:dicarboxylate/amino acid:cation symporter [Candidatus Avelusimicrobium stercoris]|uniref:dicarboxylate/amino acid:cation symporter n=1 Tax=Candidatus Avelusimicrobium stercoris TaxID=1947924 RepID=UPI003D09937D